MIPLTVGSRAACPGRRKPLSFGWLTALSMLFIFVALRRSVCSFDARQDTNGAMLISGRGLMMPVMLLPGMMFPVENMPGILRLLSNFVPAKW